MEKLYPIGIDTFSEIIDGGYVYIDKTDLVYDLANRFKNVFLSRPRRFGKSLLTSTFEAYFSGREDLFRGLKLHNKETQWKKYPVLHFSFNGVMVETVRDLQDYINDMLADYEKQYGIASPARTSNLRLKHLIKAAVEHTGMPAVVLIDEYDKPMLDVVGNKSLTESVRKKMQNFYSPLKNCGKDLRFLFLTGVTQFSQVSIFSQLNNLEIISMNSDYAAVCGITEEELKNNLNEGIQEMAVAKGWSKEECLKKLKEEYDGYHFSPGLPDIYNPFSLMQALKNRKIKAYWFTHSTPTFLLTQMRRFNAKPQTFSRQRSYPSTFEKSIDDANSITPLLYQSGYLTIKDYIEDPETYILDIPNKEVRVGLMECMVSYLGAGDSVPARDLANDMYLAFKEDDFDKVMNHLKKYLSTVPYTSGAKKDCEGHYQSLLYVLFSLMSINVQVEARTPQGRIDVVVESPKYIYLIEIKLDKSADKALEQINLKDYPARFALTGKPVRKVGANFSRKTRNITDWKIEDN